MRLRLCVIFAILAVEQESGEAMRLWEMFRRRSFVRERGELADFIDAQAAFLMQKGIYEYSRARAGHYSKVLFAEPSFQHAVEQARWRACPLGLAMCAGLWEGGG